MGENEFISLTLLRHGRSRADDEGVHEGRYDAPLTEIGHAQARIRARDFQKSGLKFDVIISSPLQRARSTAQIIAGAVQAPVVLDEDWMERDNGVLAGMKRGIAAVKHPKPAFRNPYEPLGETGESAWALYCRAARAVEQIIRRGTGRYLVVAHGGVLNAAMQTIFGIPPRGDKPKAIFRFGDLGYAHLRYQPQQGTWQLIAFVESISQSREETI